MDSSKCLQGLLPDNTLIFWATTVSFPSDPATTTIRIQVSKTKHDSDYISVQWLSDSFTCEDLEEV